MKKILAAFFAACAVAGAHGALPPLVTNLASLPIGGTNVLEAHLETVVAMVSMRADVVNHTDTNSTGYTSRTFSANYSQGMGPLGAFLTNCLIAMVQQPVLLFDTNRGFYSLPAFSTNDVGKQANFWLTLYGKTPEGALVDLGQSGVYFPRTVSIVAGSNGAPTTDSSAVVWPWAVWYPINGIRSGVSYVSTVLTYSWGNYALGASNGAYCGSAQGLPNNVIYLPVYDLFDIERNVAFDVPPTGGYVDLYYGGGSMADTLYDRFDILTGNKVHACGVKLYMSMTNGLPLVTAVSSPGTFVEIQTSTDMQNWSAVSQLLVGPDATAQFFPAGGPATQSFVVPGQSLFVRGRRTYP